MREQYKMYSHPDGKIWAGRSLGGGRYEALWGVERTVLSRGLQCFQFSHQKVCNGDLWEKECVKSRSGYQYLGIFHLVRDKVLAPAEEYTSEQDPPPTPPKFEPVHQPIDPNVSAETLKEIGGFAPIGF